MSISDDVRLEPLDQLAALAGGAGGAQHLDAVASEQQFETLAEGLVILDQHESKRHVGVWIGLTGPTERAEFPPLLKSTALAAL